MSVSRFHFESAQITRVGLNERALVSAKYVLNRAHILRPRTLLLNLHLLDRITGLIHGRAKAALLLVLSSLPLEA